MIAFKPLPQPQQPILQGQVVAPSQRYVEYWQALDQIIRALVASPPATQTANYTLALKDASGTVEMNLAGANTLTIPANSSVPFAIGTVMRFIQLGAGATTVAAAVGVTLRSRGGHVQLAGQYAVASIYKRAADEWVLSGDLV